MFPRVAIVARAVCFFWGSTEFATHSRHGIPRWRSRRHRATWHAQKAPLSPAGTGTCVSVK